ncbi:MAG: CPBP family intramembrane metalloprotease [Gemmatimonadaceae bacterium]|nr:CPBP family intramembrane metalloprotease [Gemmatimonadaceae bacterium]
MVEAPHGSAPRPDPLERLLFAAPGRLRAGYRLALFIAAWFFAVGPLRGVVTSWLPLALVPWLAPWLAPLAALGATFVLLRRIDERPWDDVGLGARARAPRQWAHGALVGSVAIAVPVALLVLTGWLARAPGTDGSVAGAMLIAANALLPAALSEELLMRGYPFTVLRDTAGWLVATAVTSVAFGLLHLGNPGVSPQAIALVIAAGIWLAAVRVVTGSLVAAWMAHFAWNWWLAAGFHAPVSGLPSLTPGWRLVDAGPDWLTGGAWGPEAGLLSAVGMIAGTALLARGPFTRRVAASAPSSHDIGGHDGRTEHAS